MSSSDARSNAAAYLGLGSVLAAALCTLWLALVGHLDLYINPRYSVFTVVLAAVGVPASIAGLVATARGYGHTHGDDADEHHADEHAAHGHATAADEHAADAHEPRPGRGRAVRLAFGGAAAVVTIGVTVAMLVLPPTTLSARTAQQRSVDSATLSNATGSESAVQLLGSEGVDTSEYGVKDWAALIRQTTDTTALVGKQVELTGFVVPGDDGSFTLTRFVISCCAVDAQPVGLGVVTGDGTGTVPDEGQWVTVRGALAANPDQSADARIVVKAAKITDIAQPEDPYEF
ncbi:TIGR03943 family putative permease subunit [Curtobacterium flaccumfaciens]|uniref:TIGR03943 family putative permease subunit n=1 Tax=Curtobacterium flaccumfaciens TaxID=2035 RepID=UPI001366A332|nr:TIGR03943 family protein [Curtobacterium flaccumfaciens]MBT1665502.1 TIGR03943 family protein [Curtobacterium flaccumfaciens pv. flaccumfaciens]QFS79551.2 TIGR03943 family protein [Curtobacterium flaccumfaciens pv. flaccumfaciens]